MSSRQRVAVVTGGAGGIGAAVAEELGRGGWYVVTVDPLVTVDGAEQLPEPAETTAGRIAAAGGSARASSLSVTDRGAIRDLFEGLAREFGALDAVVNVAGITRPTHYAAGTEEDWLAVATVHFDGYLNVLEAALPLMAAAGHGRILGVTSGSGWRPMDAGGYSAAKRAVAALTWQLAGRLPPGVTVNAMSPIAATRMVAAALERARRESGSSRERGSSRGGGGGLSLLGMPDPAELGPLGAHLVSDGFGWCNGKVVFAGGSEVALIEEPRLLEVIRTDDAASLDHLLATVIPRAFVPAEAGQSSQGGSNPRFGGVFEERPPAAMTPAPIESCVVVTDRLLLGASITEALTARSVTCHRIGVERGFGAAAKALRSLTDSVGPVDAVVLAAAGPAPDAAGGTWGEILAEHGGLVDQMHVDAAWSRAVADYATEAPRPVKFVTLTDASTSGGRSRAQAAAQQARVAAGSTKGRVAAFAVSVEATEQQAATPTGALVSHLLGPEDTATLAGAELAVGAGWIGLRGHPRPAGSVVYGGPAVPGWLDDTLREMAGLSGAVTGMAR